MIAIWGPPNGLALVPGANTLKLLAQPLPRLTLHHRDGTHDAAQSCLPRLLLGEPIASKPLVCHSLTQLC